MSDRLRAQLRRAKKELDWALTSEAAPRINAMLDLARSEPGIPVRPADLDRDPWLFNCPNGTIELQTGRLRGHRRHDLITEMCPTPYDPQARCPAWARFLGAVFRGDDELIRFVHRLFGYSL